MKADSVARMSYAYTPIRLSMGDVADTIDGAVGTAAFQRNA